MCVVPEVALLSRGLARLQVWLGKLRGL